MLKNQITDTMQYRDCYSTGLSVRLHDRRFWVALRDLFDRLSNDLQGCLEVFLRTRSVIFEIVCAFYHSLCWLIAHRNVVRKVSETLVLWDSLPTIYWFFEPSTTDSQRGEEVETLRAEARAKRGWRGERHHFRRARSQVRLRQVMQRLQLSYMTLLFHI